MFKFNKVKKGNVQELVFSVMDNYYMETGKVMNSSDLFVIVQNTRLLTNNEQAKASTIKRAYRRFKKVIEFKIIKQELLIKKLEAENIELIKLEKQLDNFAMVFLFAICCIGAISIYLIIN